jgi:lia operon protein LiaG
MKKKLSTKELLIVIILIGVIVIMSIFGTRVFAPTIEINDEKSFSLEEITSLQVDMTKEQIRIIQTQTNEVKIHYHGISKQELKLSAETNDGTIIVSSTRTTNLIYEDMYVDIYLPENFNKKIIIQATSGSVTSEKAQADNFSITTTSGSITLNNCIGTFDLETNTGGVTLNGCEGNLDLKTRSGKVILQDCIGNLDLETSSGNVSVTYKAFEEQDINIVTTSGGIQLQLPDTAEFLLDAKTSTGKLQSDFPVNMDVGKKMAGQVGTVSNQIVLQTSTGSISILKK